MTGGPNSPAPRGCVMRASRVMDQRLPPSDPPRTDVAHPTRAEVTNLVARCCRRLAGSPPPTACLGVDVEVILTQPCITTLYGHFVWRIANEIYRVVSE